MTRPSRPSTLRVLWRSTVGKKAVMAVSGIVMLLFLVVHMLGNLKIFFGPADFNGYAAWLRTIGEPILHSSWYLWAQRGVLTVCLVAHVVSAAQLARIDRKARPTRYQHHQRVQASFATNTMRYGGVILALFVTWHVLDITVGALHPHFQPDHPYQTVVADFSVWWITLLYIVAMIMLGLHIHHGFWSAAQTLGANNPRRHRVLKLAATGLSIALTCGFLAVPVSVTLGLVR